MKGESISRILLGPGPSNVHPRVLKALADPILGYFDPYLLEVMDEIKVLLRRAYKTSNDLTFPISGTGTAGMEACLCNLIEEGDEIIVGLNGYFGQRMADVASRCGARVIGISKDWGGYISKEEVEDSLKNSGAGIVALVQGETSTGVLQPIKEIAELTRQYDALFVVDAVSSLGGCELKVDEWGIDVCYSSTQKCLSSPPGLSPATVNERAMEHVRARKSKVQSLYLDFTLLEEYWSGRMVYHHTPPVSLIFALREALQIIDEEGLEQRWQRHQANSLALVQGLEHLGLEMHVDRNYRLPTLHAVKVPEGVSESDTRRALLDTFNIEIGGGLGILKGKVWRIGLMGMNSSQDIVSLFLNALNGILSSK